MEKKKYETPEFVIDIVSVCDIVTASINDSNDNEGPIPDGWNPKY